MVGYDDTERSESERRIEANLKQVYEDSMSEPMSGQLADLVAQLRKKAASKTDGTADE
ncbi:hypothetical protein SAMN06273572_105168 [Monaibacterium marinum]|uniref:Anti-sigma factor NepR domain-containing protein n=1 Tax=Pontivivens marinum TaxID=1690039 RepID=A0A2C9CTU2_9RHOB|nr:hypothetical protein [Monaibacterium marinum]SOH94744.1 hypothetical protein SAMN06273572_105168 [Monaibacterium marinum]